MGPFNFLVTPTEVQVRLGSWVVRRILVSDIERVDEARGLGVPMWNEHWCNLWPFRYVVLRRRSGWIRTFIINPPDATGFVEALRRLVSQRRGTDWRSGRHRRH